MLTMPIEQIKLRVIWKSKKIALRIEVTNILTVRAIVYTILSKYWKIKDKVIPIAA